MRIPPSQTQTRAHDKGMSSSGFITKYSLSLELREALGRDDLSSMKLPRVFERDSDSISEKSDVIEKCELVFIDHLIT